MKPPKAASEDDLTPEPSDVDDAEGEEEVDGSEAMVREGWRACDADHQGTAPASNMDSDSDEQSDDEFDDDDGDDDPDFGASSKPKGKGPPKLKKCTCRLSHLSVEMRN